MDPRALLLRDDWQSKADIEQIRLELLQLVDIVNRFHASAKSRLALLHEKVSSMERNLRYVEMSARTGRERVLLASRRDELPSTASPSRNDADGSGGRMQ